MVRILVQTNEDHEMIFLYTNYKAGDQSVVEKIITFYKFSDPKSCSLFCEHLNASCEICHQQSYLLAKLVQEILNIVEEKDQINIKNALFDSFKQNFNDESIEHTRNSTIYGLLARNQIIDNQKMLEIFMEYLNSSKLSCIIRQEMFIIQVLFMAGDILYKFDPKLTKKIINRLDRREFKTRQMFDNECQISFDLNTPGLIPTSDYYCFKYDDVSYLQKLASSPNFDVNRAFEVPVWELELCRFSEVSLIAAAAFYGAEKCFRYLLMLGATLEPPFSENLRPIGRLQGRVFRPGPVAIRAIRKLNQTNSTTGAQSIYVIKTCAPPMFIFFRDITETICNSDRSNIGAAEAAIAGNHMKLLQIIDQTDENALRYPLTYSAVFNRYKEFNWFLSRSSIEKENPDEFLNFISATDNHVILRKLLDDGLINLELLASTNAINFSQKCLIEIMIKYYDNPRFKFILSKQHNGFRSYTPERVDERFIFLASNSANKSIFQVISSQDLEELRVFIHKKQIDMILLLSSTFGNRINPIPLSDVSEELAKELLKSPEMKVLFEKQGKDMVTEFVEFNNFKFVDWALSQEEIRNSYTRENLLSYASSLEMRNLINKYYKSS